MARQLTEKEIDVLNRRIAFLEYRLSKSTIITFYLLDIFTALLLTKSIPYLDVRINIVADVMILIGVHYVTALPRRFIKVLLLSHFFRVPRYPKQELLAMGYNPRALQQEFSNKWRRLLL